MHSELPPTGCSICAGGGRHPRPPRPPGRHLCVAGQQAVPRLLPLHFPLPGAQLHRYCTCLILQLGVQLKCSQLRCLCILIVSIPCLGCRLTAGCQRSRQVGVHSGFYLYHAISELARQSIYELYRSEIVLTHVSSARRHLRDLHGDALSGQAGGLYSEQQTSVSRSSSNFGAASHDSRGAMASASSTC